MNKVVKFQDKALEVSFGLNMKLEVLPTDEDYAFVDFSTDSNNVIVNESSNSLKVLNADNASLTDELKNVKSIGDVIGLFVKQGIQGKLDNSISGSGKLYIPKNNESLELKVNNGEVLINSSLKKAKIKLNNGDLIIKGDIQECEIKGNNIKLETSSNINYLAAKFNNGKATLSANSNVKVWNIKSNKADITIHKNDFGGEIRSNKQAAFPDAIGIETRGNLNII